MAAQLQSAAFLSTFPFKNLHFSKDSIVEPIWSTGPTELPALMLLAHQTMLGVLPVARQSQHDACEEQIECKATLYAARLQAPMHHQIMLQGVLKTTNLHTQRAKKQRRRGMVGCWVHMQQSQTLTSAMLSTVLVTVGFPLDPTAMLASTFSWFMRTSTVAKSIPALQTSPQQE